MMSDSVSFRRRAKQGGNPESSGYVSMEDDNLQHSGVRGGRSCCLCALVVVLLLVAVANALVTAGLFYFLSVTHIGMESVELLREGNYIRVLTNLDVENLTMYEDLIGRNGHDIAFEGQQVSVAVQNGSQVSVEEDQILLLGSKLELYTDNGKPLFSTDADLSLDVYQVKNLHAPYVEVGSISSLSMFPDLFIESFHDTEVMGMEGVSVFAGGKLEVCAPQNEIVLNSLFGTLKFDQKEGLFLDPNIPLEGKGSYFSTAENQNQYKVCVCGTSGKVFAVPDRGPGSGCHLANENVNPCFDY